MSSDSKLMSFREELTFSIYGQNDNDPGGWVFPKLELIVIIYDSYIELIGVKQLVSKGSPMVNIAGIIPFHSILPTSQYYNLFPPIMWKRSKAVIEDYFTYNKKFKNLGFIFDPKFGWEKIPMFLKTLNAKLNEIIISSNAQYEELLGRSFVGPYMAVGIAFRKNKKIFNDVIKLLKNQNFANPPKQKDGKIIMKYGF